MAERSYSHKEVVALTNALKEKSEKLEKENQQLKEKIAGFESEKKDLAKKADDIEKREAALLPKEQELSEKEEKISKEMESISSMKAGLLARETRVKDDEKAFDAIKEKLLKGSEDLAAKKAEFYEQAEKTAAELREKRIAETEAEVQKIRDSVFAENESKREAAKKEYEAVLAQAEQTSENIRARADKEAEETVGKAAKKAQEIVAEAEKRAKEIIEKAKSDTSSLEAGIEELERRNAELSGKNTELEAGNKELTEDKRTLSERLETQKREHNEALAENIKLLDQFTTLQEELKACGKDVKTLSDEIIAMDAREQNLNDRDDKLKEREAELLFNETKNKNKARELEEKEADIDEEVRNRYPEMKAELEAEIEDLNRQTDNLRGKLRDNESIVAKFDDLTAQFNGKNPAEIMLDYDRIQKELAIALAKVTNTPSYTLQKQAEELNDWENKLKERENKLAESERASRNFLVQYNQTQAANNELQSKNEALEKDKKILEEQLNRLRSTYENPAVREDRIKEINKPVAAPAKRLVVKNLTEKEWLGNIESKMNSFGLHFPRRILHAFHTALKTSEMSPLTVLAGVSGTGKSELPRLYSHFGGINFLSVPVQPNWDCQEAMLGYYNSIDNCFEPTDMLRLLAQSQRNADDQNGLNDVMTMILLDEMNLANVELYFADFLSKLETRRGLSDADVPYLGVKIGSKMKDWELKLGRNVLWTGTMNNDETTKTLSDKVLDRGIVINFPRPTTLIRSKKNRVLGDPSALLPRIIWDSWKSDAYSFKQEEIDIYKKKVEEINEQLGKAGRALGHRVWQSIESYMSLYPDVIAAQGDKERELAMDKAFEDQLVQKVMPKLRGLETRGTQKDVLDAVDGIIGEKATDAFHDDFKNAVAQNYGQFIWTTSAYLLKDDDYKEAVDNAETTEDSGSSDVPAEETKSQKAKSKTTKSKKVEPAENEEDETVKKKDEIPGESEVNDGEEGLKLPVEDNSNDFVDVDDGESDGGFFNLNKFFRRK
ncbi:hypothetical protein J5690_05810 [bacterium]|nr:hypothetical protein [bacterium]